MNASPYRYRTSECPDCFEGRYERPEGPGYVSCKCDECEGRGEIDASCAECLVIAALNDDGLCEKCTDASTMPVAEFEAKYALAPVERISPTRIAA